MKQYLRNYINYQQNNWIYWFLLTEYIYKNNNLHFVINIILFQALYNEFFIWKNIVQKTQRDDIFVSILRFEQMTKMRRYLKRNWKIVSNKQQKYYNVKHIEFKSYNVENMIYLCVKNICFIKSFKKLNCKYYKSYQINNIIDKQIYRLKFSFNINRIHNVFHVFLLKFCFKDFEKHFHSFFIEINDKKQWKIKKILNSQKLRNKFQYYIRWLKYENIKNIKNQWMNVDNIHNVKQFIVKYHWEYSKQINAKRVKKRKK